MPCPGSLDREALSLKLLPGGLSLEACRIKGPGLEALPGGPGLEAWGVQMYGRMGVHTKYPMHSTGYRPGSAAQKRKLISSRHSALSGDLFVHV